MNDFQSIIDRQLGLYSRLTYDSVLKRLVVHSEESYYGLQSDPPEVTLEQDPPIFACRFSEASGYEHILALANEDGRVAIQDTTSIRSASKLEGFQCHNNAVFDLAWMPHYMNFVTVSGDHTACLWDVAEAVPRRVLTFAHHTRSVKTVAFRPQEPSVFATGARDGHILLWDVRAAKPAAQLLRPDNCLSACHSAAAPKTPGSAKRARPDTRAGSVTGLVFQDDATLVSCGECDGNIKAWDLRKSYSAYAREPLPKRSIPYCGSSTKNGYSNLVVDDARVRLYASCMDSVIYCFNVATYSALPERRYVGHENGTFYIKAGLSPDGCYLVSGSSDKHAYVWNVKSSRPLVRLAGHHAEVTCAAWCPARPAHLVTCSDDARHMLWRVGPEEPTETPAPGRAEPPPRIDIAPPPWGEPSRPSVQRRRDPPKSKRCLADSLEAADIRLNKRQRLNETLTPRMAVKRRRDSPESVIPQKTIHIETRSPCASGSHHGDTATDDALESIACSPTTKSPPGTPVKVSHCKIRIVCFTTPTKNLPDYVSTGEAPHLRIQSPARKRPETADWLTLLARGKRGVPTMDKAESPKSPTPSRRNSTTEKTPKSNSKNRTLLKYFNVSAKEK